MTRSIDPNDMTELRETRVRIPKQLASPIFQGWGPKF